LTGAREETRSTVAAGDASRPLDVLFIGNSFTARNQLPSVVAALVAPRHALRTGLIQAGGASLKRHWNAGLAQRALASQHWDRVVLQEQSTLPLKSPQRFHENVRLFAPVIAAHGATPLLYLTWSRTSVPEAQRELTYAVETIAREVGAGIVPVGVAWHAVRTSHPDIALYDADGSHPTPTGSYLAACVFAASLFRVRVARTDVAERLRIDRATAERLHDVAWSTFEHYASSQA
jgi:hypothetical protein